jgi:hypothetical protein
MACSDFKATGNIAELRILCMLQHQQATCSIATAAACNTLPAAWLCTVPCTHSPSAQYPAPTHQVHMDPINIALAGKDERRAGVVALTSSVLSVRMPMMRSLTSLPCLMRFAASRDTYAFSSLVLKS